MPRQKSQSPRNIILPIRFTQLERSEISKRAGTEPTSRWIRQVVFASLEVAQQDKQKAPNIQSEKTCEQTPEDQVPLPITGEHLNDYAARLNNWIEAAGPDSVVEDGSYEAAIQALEEYEKAWSNRTLG
jgi:hypothetical protein